VTKSRKQCNIFCVLAVLPDNFGMLSFLTFSLGALTPAVDEISFVEWWRKVLKKVHKNRKKGFNRLIILGSWCLWLTRNKAVFDGVNTS
jgi:hypothetical protein